MRSILRILFLLFLFASSLVQSQSCTIIAADQNSLALDTIYIGREPIQFLDSLNTIGFHTLEIIERKENPCEFRIHRGQQFKRIYLSQNSILNPYVQKESTQNKFYTLSFDNYVQKIKDSLDQIGQPFGAIRIKPKGYFHENAFTEVTVESEKQRNIDEIKIIGYDKVPKFIKRQITKNHKTYSPSTVLQIESKLNTYDFLNQTQSPKVSFTKDSTTLYIYLQKRKLNLFEGLLGFESDAEGKFNLQGNVSIQLYNTFNRAEKINLSWQSGLNKSQNLDFALSLPYIFNSNFGVNSAIQLQKQDSSFVRVQMRNGLTYQFGNNHYISGNWNLASSNFIKSTQSTTADFSKNGFGITYFFQKSLFSKFQENKSFLEITSGIWNQTIKDKNKKVSQSEIIYHLARQQNIWKNHYAYASLAGKNLIQDDPYLENDLYQLGGFNSLRGFNQNSIYTPSYNLLSLAYRYIPNDQIFVELFSDLALIKNKEMISNTLNSIGIGMHFFTKFGLFQINYALGKANSEGFDFSNGKIHIGIKNFF